MWKATWADSPETRPNLPRSRFLRKKKYLNENPFSSMPHVLLPEMLRFDNGGIFKHWNIGEFKDLKRTAKPCNRQRELTASFCRKFGEKVLQTTSYGTSSPICTASKALNALHNLFSGCSIHPTTTIQWIYKGMHT